MKKEKCKLQIAYFPHSAEKRLSICNFHFSILNFQFLFYSSVLPYS
jgi:hypothetical protein